MSGVIGAAPIALGLIEGCAEAAAGFTAYRVNVNGESYRDDRDVAGTELRNFWAYIRENGSIKIETSVIYKSVKIRVLNSSQVEISKY